MPAERPGQMPREEMLAHLHNGRSVLVSPVYRKDEDGNYAEAAPGRHVASPRDLPSVLEAAIGDPQAMARAKDEARASIERARKELEELEEADAKPEPTAPAAPPAAQVTPPSPSSTPPAAPGPKPPEKGK
jgi:hypothetical protein